MTGLPTPVLPPVQWQCNSCSGTYFPVLLDGTMYFHRCPPGTANPRNENIHQALGGGPVTIIAAGSGITVI